jgi:hypothetical protein
VYRICAGADSGSSLPYSQIIANKCDTGAGRGNRTPMELLPTDFEPGVSSLYRQLPSYTALFNGNSIVFQRPQLTGIPSYMALYPALRCKQPPSKPLNLTIGGF